MTEYEFNLKVFELEIRKRAVLEAVILIAFLLFVIYLLYCWSH